MILQRQNFWDRRIEEFIDKRFYTDKNMGSIAWANAPY